MISARAKRAATGLDDESPAPMRIGDHLALDFLNSVMAPRGTIIESLGDGAGLVTWMNGSGSLGERPPAAEPAAEFDKIAAEARDLREWFRGALMRVKASGLEALTAADFDRLNGALARGPVFSCLEADPDGGRPRVIDRRPLREPAEWLAPLALAMAELISEADFSLVRKCENPACTLWFYDRTKAHRRRWCSQAVCGNRAKVAAFRSRQQAGS